MDAQRFYITDYLSPEEHFHLAFKALAKRYPRSAHDHDFYEVCLVETGRVEHWVNGVVQVLERGDLVFIRPADTHAVKAGGQGCRIINVMFRAETARHLVARYSETFAGQFFDAAQAVPSVLRLSGPQLGAIVEAAAKLQAQIRSLARIEQFLLLLANELVRPLAVREDRGPRWFANACTAVRHKALFRQGAAGLIVASGRSHEHVCRTCREVLGMTPSAYVNHIRIDYAAQLLRSTSLSIREVSDDCGIENLGHFYRLFRKQTGVTPRSFRRKMQADPFEAR